MGEIKTNVGTFKIIKNELHFLDYFSKKWEPFNKEYIDLVFTKDEWQKLKKYLGNFEGFGN